MFEVTLDHAELMTRMPRTSSTQTSRSPQPQRNKAPGRLGRQSEVSGGAPGCLRRRPCVPAKSLKVTDVDSDRLVLRVEQAKGHRDRYAMLSSVLLNCLRTWSEREEMWQKRVAIRRPGSVN